MAKDVIRPFHIPVVLFVAVAVILPCLLLRRVSAGPVDSVPSSDVSLAISDASFLLKLRAEVDRDRLLFVAQNSVIRHELSTLTAKLSDLDSQVSIIQGQLSTTGTTTAGGGGGGRNTGRGDDGGTPDSGQQTGHGQGNSSQGQESGSGSGSGSGNHGSCPSGCRVASEVNRVQAALTNTRSMVYQAVKDLQDHLTDMTADAQMAARNQNLTDSRIHDHLSRHDGVLDSLMQRVGHLEAVRNLVVSSSSSSSSAPTSFFSSTPAASSPGLPGPSLAPSEVLTHLPRTVDSLKQQVKVLAEEQQRALKAQNSRMTQVEHDVTQLHTRHSSLEDLVKNISKAVDSNSHRLQMAELQASESDRAFNQSLSEVNISLSSMGDTLHVLQNADSAHAAIMRHLTNQQLDLSSRSAGNANRITSLVSDVSHLDRRVSVMSGMVQSGAQELRALNYTLQVMMASPASSSAPTLLPSSLAQTTQPVKTTVTAGTTRSPGARGTISTAPAPYFQTSRVPMRVSARSSTTLPMATPSSVPVRPVISNTSTASTTTTAAAVSAKLSSPRPVVTAGVSTSLPVASQGFALSSQPAGNAATPTQTPRKSASSFMSALSGQSTASLIFPTPKMPGGASTQSPVTVVPTRKPGAGLTSSDPLTYSPTFLVPPSSTSISALSPSTAVPTREPDSVSPSMGISSKKPDSVTSGMAVPTRRPESVSPSKGIPTMKPNSVNPSMAVPTKIPNSVSPGIAVSTKKPDSVNPSMPVPTRNPDSITSSIAVPTRKPDSVNPNMAIPTKMPKSGSPSMAIPTRNPVGVGTSMAVPTMTPDTGRLSMAVPTMIPNSWNPSMAVPTMIPNSWNPSMAIPTRKPNRVSASIAVPTMKPDLVSPGMAVPTKISNSVRPSMTIPIRKPNWVGPSMVVPTRKPDSVRPSMAVPTRKPESVSPSMAVPTMKPDLVSPSMAVPTMKPDPVSPSMAVPTKKPNTVTQSSGIAVPSASLSPSPLP